MTLSFREIYYGAKRDSENFVKQHLNKVSVIKDHLKAISYCRDNKNNHKDQLNLAESLTYISESLSVKLKNPHKIIEGLDKFIDVYIKEKPTYEDVEVYTTLKKYDQEVESILLDEYKRWLNIIEIFVKADENKLDIYMDGLNFKNNHGFISLLGRDEYLNITDLTQWDNFVARLDEYSLPTIQLKKICNSIKPKNCTRVKEAKINKKKAYGIIASYIRDLSDDDKDNLFFGSGRNENSEGYKSQIKQLIRDSEEKVLFQDRSGYTTNWDENFYSNLWDEVRRDLKAELKM